MNDKDIQALKALAEAATPEPWEAVVGETVTIRDVGGQLAIYTHLNTVTGGRRNPDQVAANARLGAALRNAVPKLFLLIEQQAARIAELEALLAAPARDVGGLTELTDERIQAIWDEACKDTPQQPGWCRHIRYARAIEREVLSTKAAEPVQPRVDILLRELLGISTSNRRGVGARVDDMRKLILAFQKNQPATSPAPSASQGEIKVPEGFAIVPVEPTTAMLIAGVKGFQKAGYNDCDKLNDWTACYRAMIAAAPAPSVTDGEV